MHQSHEFASQDQSAEKDDSKIDRRDALKKMGRYGAYTAPIMLAMLSKEANAEIPCSIGDICGG